MARSKVGRTAPSPAPSRFLRLPALGLLGAAGLVSGWLAYQALQNGAVPGCNGGDCGAVLSSKWAKTFGIPVGAFGAGAYLALAILGSRPFLPGQRGPRIVAGALALLIPAAALWFAGLQLLVLHAFCPWCSATHAIATTGAILMALAWKRDAAAPEPAARRRAGAAAVRPVWAPAAACAALAFGGFVLAQVLGPEPPKARVVTASMNAPAASPGRETSAPAPANPATPGSAAPTPDTAPHLLRLHQGKVLLDPKTLPCFGNPEARHRIVLISDYTCVHCRHAQRTLHQVRAEFAPDDLAVVQLPSHHGGDSLEIQRLMLATWRLDPEAWHDVGTEIYAERIPAEPARVRTVLEQRIGADRLAGALRTEEAWTTNLFATSKQVMMLNREKTGSSSIPQFIMGEEIVVGAPEDAGEFFQLFEKNLQLVRARFPELSPAVREIDLGRVFAGTTRLITLPFTNTGNAPLQISRVNAPGGSRILRGLNTPVAPGATSAVDIAFAAPREAGTFERNLGLFSNARTPETPIAVKVEVWKPIQVTPPILDFGRLEDGHTSTQGVLRIEFAEPAHLASVRSQNPGFSSALREVQPGRVYEIDVATTPALGAGPQQGILVAELRQPIPDGWPANIALGARARVDRAVIALPSQVVVPAGVLATERTQQVLVRCNDGTAGFTVSDAVLDGGPAFARPDIQPGSGTNDFLVRLTLPAGWSMPVPPATARLILHTSHPRYPTLEVPVVTPDQ